MCTHWNKERKIRTQQVKRSYNTKGGKHNATVMMTIYNTVLESFSHDLERTKTKDDTQTNRHGDRSRGT